MSQTMATIRPARYWYLLSLIILFSGIWWASWIINSAEKKFLQIIHAKTPGGSHTFHSSGRIERRVKLTNPGSYSVYVYRPAPSRGESRRAKTWKAAKTAKVSVQNVNGRSLIYVKYAYDSIEIQGVEVARIIEFEIPHSGEYVIHMSARAGTLSVQPTYPLSKLELDEMNMEDEKLSGLLIGVFAVVISIVIFVIVLVLRYFCRKKMLWCDGYRKFI